MSCGESKFNEWLGLVKEYAVDGCLCINYIIVTQDLVYNSIVNLHLRRAMVSLVKMVMCI